MRKFLLLLLTFSLLTGCAKQVHKSWLVAGGSKADASITLMFDYDPSFERPITSQEQAIRLASQRCKAWGFEGAEPFGTIIEDCIARQYTAFGVVCHRVRAISRFQCVGSATPAPAPTTTEKK